LGTYLHASTSILKVDITSWSKAKTTMPSYKPIDHNNKAAFPKQQQKKREFHSPAPQNACVSSNDNMTPLDAWLSPGGTRKPAEKRSLSTVEGVAKKLKVCLFSAI
jgi:hypothetical protein